MIKNLPLPYPDTKPQGAADFYFAINATFRFVKSRLGIEGLRRYWADLGGDYYRPVTEYWTSGGLAAVAAYWKAFFEAEPGADFIVKLEEKRVVVEVRQCPAIKHLRQHSREIVPEYCQHCHYVSDSIGAAAGIAARVRGGNGACIQEFGPSADAPSQNLNLINSCA